VLDQLLAHPDVFVESEIRGTLGLMAFHGGGLEEATDIIAKHAAAMTGSSYYGIHQPADLKWHIPSHRIDPQHSVVLDHFLSHVDTVITTCSPVSAHAELRETVYILYNRVLYGRVDLAWVKNFQYVVTNAVFSDHDSLEVTCFHNASDLFCNQGVVCTCGQVTVVNCKGISDAPK
jgi:hypothetical protein